MAANSRKHEADAVLLFGRGLEEVKAFAGNLNTEFYRADIPVEGMLQEVRVDYRPVRQELRRLVRAWCDSGPNVSKLFESEPIMARHALNIRAHIIPTKKGTARLDYLTVPEKMPGGEPLSIAVGLFLSFLLNPYNHHLGGPCRHCGNYYVKITKRQKVYCSALCGRRRTALRFNQNQRADDRSEQLKRAKRFISQWRAANTKLDWKEWVHKEAQISKNWLTRAVKKHEIPEPVRLTSYGVRGRNYRTR